MSGRRAIPGLVLAVWLATAAAAVAPAAAQEWTFRTGGHVDAWSGVGQDGHEVLLPYGLSFTAPDWGVGFRGAYGTSERDAGSGLSGSFTGFTDTTLTGFYRLTTGNWEFQAALDMDLPVGVSRLSNRQLVAIQDEDLVLLDRFGEGFDINPTIIAYHHFGAFGLGVGLGYLRKGEYDPTRDVAGDDLDPGDELTAAILGDVYVLDAVRLMARASYTYFTTDTRGGVETFREGEELDFRVSAEWRPEPWYVVVTLRDIVQLKAERLDTSGRLATEPHNSNGNDFRAGLTVGYIINDRWSVEGSAAVRWVGANDYPAGDLLRDGGRVKVAFGPAVTWSPTRTLAVSAGVAYFILDVEQSPIFPRAGTIQGVHADLRLTIRF
jgi:hypothetical protein